MMGPFVGGGLVGGTSSGGVFPVLTCYQRIDSYSPIVASGMYGGCEEVGVFIPVLAAAIPWRLSMIFEARWTEGLPGLLGWSPGWPFLAPVLLGTGA